MKKITLSLTAETLKVMNLDNKQNVTEDEAAVAFANMAAQAGLVTGLNTQINTLTQQNTELTNKLTALQAAASEKTVTDMINAAVEDTRITKEAGDIYANAFKSNPAGLKTILDSMKPYKPASEQLNQENPGEPTKVDPKNKAALKKEYEEAHKNGTLEEIKNSNPEHFKALFTAKYGTAPKH